MPLRLAAGLVAAIALIAGVYLAVSRDSGGADADRLDDGELTSDSQLGSAPTAPAEEVGLAALRTVRPIATVLDTVASRDVDAILDLFERQTLSCKQIREAPADCAARNGEVAGRYEAIAIEDGGTRWTLAEVRARRLIDAIMAAGKPRLALATRDERTPAGGGGTYYLAFLVPEFDASDPAFNYEADTVGVGFGLRLVAGTDAPVVELSLLSPTWDALDWRRNYGGRHLLLYPDAMSNYTSVYAELPEDY